MAVYDLHSSITVGIEERDGEPSLVVTLECIQISHNLSSLSVTQAFERILPIVRFEKHRTHRTNVEFIITDDNPEFKTKEFIEALNRCDIDVIFREPIEE